MRHGMGKMFYAPREGITEASYNGSWAGGKRSGLGILTMANGDRYEGHWLDDKKEGPGRYFYKSTNKVRMIYIAVCVHSSFFPWSFSSPPPYILVFRHCQ